MPEEKMSKQQQQLKEITERLEKGVQELFSTEQYTEYLRVMSQFHNYSFSNILLIAMQKPDAMLVAGYGAWQKKFERNVMRGEKAIKIFAPAPRKVEVEREVLDPVTQRPVLDESGEPLKETVTVKKPYFKIASVFDVSQTEGKPLPELAQVQELTGSVEGYNLFFDALCRTSGVPIAFEPISGSTHGYYHQVEKRIAIAEGMSEAQNVKTAIHEIAHSRLHDVDMMDEANGIMIDRRTREVQAESDAYTVCQHYGIDTSDYSFGYIAGWSEGREMKELRSSMEVIRREADSMIKAIDANLEEIRREQELAAENPFIDEQTVEQPTEGRGTGGSEVSVKEGEAIAADQPFSEAVQMSSADEELTAEDITNFKGLNREYYAASRTRIYTFACDVRGESDTLTYELSYHDDDDGFTLHTGKNDIWERMSMRELRRLENVVSQEAILYDWQQEIREADSVEAVHDLQYSFYDTENLSLSDTNIDRLVSMFNERVRELNGGQEIGSDAPEKVTIGSFFVERDPHNLGG